MRAYHSLTVILALGMLCLGAGVGRSVAAVVGAGERRAAVAHVVPAAVSVQAYFPLISKSIPPTVSAPGAGAGWLAWVNYYRALAYLPPLAEDAALTDGAQKHAHYMVLNSVVEPFEVSLGRQGYTAPGAVAAANSLLLGSTTDTTTDAQALAVWMQGPFHALGVLDPALRRTGFGSDRNAGSATIKMAAALDVLSGLDPAHQAEWRYPIQWPADGVTVPLNAYTQGTDAPEPLTSCPGYLSPAGLPILVQLGTGSLPTVTVTSSALRLGATVLEHCVFTENTYTNPDSDMQARGRALLAARDAIVIIPRYPLVAGASYWVSVTVNRQTIRWTFSVSN